MEDLGWHHLSLCFTLFHVFSTQYVSNQKPQEVGSKDTGKDMTCRKGRVSDVDGMQGWWQELPSWERRVGGLRETGETGVSARWMC